MTQKTVNLSGELTFDTVQANEKMLGNAFSRSEVSEIMLDLTSVTRCDSAGLALLVEAKRLARTFQKNLQIQGASQSIHALAEFCGLDMLFNEEVVLDDK